MDADVEPIVEKLNAAAAAIRTQVVPAYGQLDEGKILSDGSLEDQATLCIASAYALTSALYVYKRCNGEEPDAQLKAKVERVGEYIRKIKAADIQLRERVLEQRAKDKQGGADARSDDSGDEGKPRKRVRRDQGFLLRVNTDATMRLVRDTAAGNDGKPADS